jgi:hypothetical protein
MNLFFFSLMCFLLFAACILGSLSNKRIVKKILDDNSTGLTEGGSVPSKDIAGCTEKIVPTVLVNMHNINNHDNPLNVNNNFHNRNNIPQRNHGLSAGCQDLIVLFIIFFSITGLMIYGVIFKGMSI